MLKIDRVNGKLIRLRTESLSNSGITERSDLQQLVLKNADEFFRQECGEDLFILEEEVRPSEHVLDRIDLLALDNQGRIVIIELKRGNNKLQLLQALSYAAMIAAERSDESSLRSLVKASDRRNALDAFLSENEITLGDLNATHRIILIAEAYDYEVLQTAVWLTENHGLNITCYEVALAQDSSSSSEYLSAVQLYPPKKLADQARKRGAIRAGEENRFQTIEERLEENTNPDVREFFIQWLSTSPRMNRRNDSIVVPRTGKMRFLFTPRRDYARVSQWGRFQGDHERWQILSGGQLRVKANGLRFRLSSKNQLATFKNFVETELHTVSWLAASETEADVEEDEDV